MTDRYPTVDPAELEPEYSAHCERIGELVDFVRLDDQQFVATQLALRDREIARLVGEDSGGRCEACGHYEADLKRAREFAHCPSCNTGTRGGNLWLRVAPGDAAAIQSLAAERDAALARVRELEAQLESEATAFSLLGDEMDSLRARIRELTEWRPMETAPKRQCYVLVLQRGVVTMRLRYPDTDGSYDGWNKGWLNNDTDEAVGWLPLPEAPRG